MPNAYTNPSCKYSRINTFVKEYILLTGTKM